MDQSQLSWLTNFIWNIADGVLRDVYVRGKYRSASGPAFYNTSPFLLRDLILALGQEKDGLLSEITQGAAA